MTLEAQRAHRDTIIAADQYSVIWMNGDPVHRILSRYFRIYSGIDEWSYEIFIFYSLSRQIKPLGSG